MADKPTMVFPIGITYPMDIYLDRNTGELVFECIQLIGEDSQKMRFLMEPKAALQLLSALPEIQKGGADIILEKAKLSSLQ